MKFRHLLAATMLAATSPAIAQTQSGTPAFRVPLGQEGAASSGPAVYAWMQNVGTCSSSCGTGTRSTSFQCQDVSSYDFSSGGYGAPEADSFCSASSAKPAASTTACTNYSGCSYDWVKPAVAVTIKVKPNEDNPGTNYPAGAVNDCSFARRVYAPTCKRTGSGSVTLPESDHAFCKNDRPDYDDVAAGIADALGYDRETDVMTGCIPGSRDHGWKTGPWGPRDSDCSATPTQTRTVECTVKFNGALKPDSDCTGMPKPGVTQTATASYTSCSKEWEISAWSSYTSTCSDTANRTRTVVCRRSDGTAVADSECAAAGVKPTTSETGPNLVGCSYSWGTPTAWVNDSNCSDSTTRRRTVACKRSDGVTASDAQCAPVPKPVTVETGVSSYTSCTYVPRDMGRSTCTAAGTQDQYWDCTRSDGTTGYPASYCGKTNPQQIACTPPTVYTYVPVKRGETACSGGQKQVLWDCTRNDGATGFPASMCGKTSPETQSCVMPVTYTPRKTGESACAGSQKNIYWDCLGSDGGTYPANMCGKTNPEVQSCVMPITYSPRKTGESACAGSQKNVYWDCLGSDGGSYPANMCGKTNPEVQSCVMPITYSYVVDGWSGYNSSCSSNAIRTRGVYCRGSNGANYPDANCAGAKPVSSESAAIYTGCSYATSYGNWSSCSGGTQSRPVTCTRSDGVQVSASQCGMASTQSQSCVVTSSCSAAFTSPGLCSGNAMAVGAAGFVSWDPEAGVLAAQFCQNVNAACCQIIQFQSTDGYGTDVGSKVIATDGPANNTGPFTGVNNNSYYPGGGYQQYYTSACTRN